MKAKERIKELEAKIDVLMARVAALEARPNYVPNSEQPWYGPPTFKPGTVTCTVANCAICATK